MEQRKGALEDTYPQTAGPQPATIGGGGESIRFIYLE